MTKRTPLMTVAAAQKAYDDAYAAYQAAYQWIGFVERPGDVLLDRFNALNARLDMVCADASLGITDGEIGVLLGERDRLYDDYAMSLPCRAAARRRAATCASAFQEAGKNLDRAERARRPRRHLAMKADDGRGSPFMMQEWSAVDHAFGGAR